MVDDLIKELPIDIAALLAPVPGARPAGPSLRDDASGTSPYYDVRRARGLAHDAETEWYNNELLQLHPWQADEARERAMQLWGEVRQNAETLLRDKSKDLELLEWLIESLFRLEDFAGLHAGFVLAAELLETYWDDVHYFVDPDDRTSKGLSFERLSKTLVGPIRRTPLTPPAGDKAPLTLMALQSMQITEAAFGEAQDAARAGGWPFYRRLGGHIRGSIDAWLRIDTTLQARMNDDAPWLSPLTTLLFDLENRLTLVAGPLADPPVVGG